MSILGGALVVVAVWGLWSLILAVCAYGEEETRPGRRGR